MGEVYRARDPRIGREVAIKVLPASFADSTDRLQRFEREARAAGTLSHPNLVTIHELGSHQGSPYMVMELLEGLDLGKLLLDAGRIGPRRAVDLDVLPQDLDGDVLAEIDVVGFEDEPHPAESESGFDAIFPQQHAAAGWALAGLYFRDRRDRGNPSVSVHVK